MSVGGEVINVYPAERKMLLERIMDAIERVNMLEEVEKRGAV